MRRILAGLAVWLLCLPLPAWSATAAPQALPAPGARLTDLTGTLDAAQRSALEMQLADIERRGQAQIAVLLLPTTQPESIEQFGIRLAETWKTGRKGENNGIIVIVAKNDRKMRIEVGYGLEGLIPDATAKRIISEAMAPRFRQGDFSGGIAAALSALDQAIAGPNTQPAPAPFTPSGTFAEPEPDYAAVAFFLALCGVVLAIVKHYPWVAWPAIASYVASEISRTMVFSWLPVGNIARAEELARTSSWIIAASVFILVAFLIPKNIRYDSGNAGGGNGDDASGGSSYDGGGDSGGGGGDFGGGGASGDW